MKTLFGALIFGLTCFILGMVVMSNVDRARGLKPSGTVTQVAQPGGVDLIAPQGPVTVDFTNQPLWAYGFERRPEPGEKAQPQAAPNRRLRPSEPEEAQTRPRRLEGSTATYSLLDVRDGQNVIDWHPQDHPPMPDIIKHGPRALGDKTRGCGSCHLPNGHGRPENAAPAALPKEYFIRQIRDFRAGRRYTADPRKPNTNTMIDLARAMSEEEIQQAADYFGAIPWSKRVRVVESALVPKTRIAGNLFLATDEALSEPIGGRIIEVPEDEERTEQFRDPRVGFVAYVPPGSLERGRALVDLGGMTVVNNQIVQGKTTACTACHGLDLMGVADVPPIAGRSPSYIARQLFDIQQGTRNGPNVQLMKLVVARLTPEDMVDVSAYVASRFPTVRPAGPLVSLR
ncbi:MAG: c-type cytochrome [Vicinamibacterales bacterium]